MIQNPCTTDVCFVLKSKVYFTLMEATIDAT